MRVEIPLPDWGMAMEEGTILSWEAEVGDAVEQGDALAVVETAKVEAELESPVAGVVAEILAREGDTVPIGTPVIAIDTADT
jgi:pyruvate/2-oxoglutarate dehydrogenase complex dihydrolipoamide acyltransferase (E2) component